MRRSLRRVGLALAAMGGLGLTEMAAAQSPLGRSRSSNDVIMPVSSTTPVAEPAVVPSDEAIRVELALHADSMLFPYGLSAQVQGASIEVKGYVPTQAVRELALKVASQQTPVPVLDRMQIHNAIVSRTSVSSPELLARSARETLELAFAPWSKGLDVRADARGRITVTGMAPTMEDRLAVSRKLRRVGGCNCVDNRMTVEGAAVVAVAAPPPPPVSRTSPAIAPSAPPPPIVPTVLPSNVPPLPMPQRGTPSGPVTLTSPPASPMGVPPMPSVPVTALPTANGAVAPRMNPQGTPSVGGAPLTTVQGVGTSASSGASKMVAPGSPSPLPPTQAPLTLPPTQARPVMPVLPSTNSGDSEPGTWKPTTPTRPINPPMGTLPTPSKAPSPNPSTTVPAPSAKVPVIENVRDPNSPPPGTRPSMPPLPNLRIQEPAPVRPVPPASVSPVRPAEATPARPALSAPGLPPMPSLNSRTTAPAVSVPSAPVTSPSASPAIPATTPIRPSQGVSLVPPPATVARPPARPTDAYVTTGTISFTDEDPKGNAKATTSPIRQVSATEEPTVRPVTPGMSKPLTPLPTAPGGTPGKPSGVPATVISPTSVARATPSIPETIKQKIEQQCGLKSHQIQVSSRGAKYLEITVAVATESEAQKYSDRILKMQELAPYEVDLRVELRP